MATLLKNQITTDQAHEWNKRWRDAVKDGSIVRTELKNSFLYDRAEFEALLAEEGVSHIRVYMGVNENNEQTTMLVGVKYDEATKTDEEIVNITPGNSGVFDLAKPCPPFCPRVSLILYP